MSDFIDQDPGREGFKERDYLARQVTPVAESKGSGPLHQALGGGLSESRLAEIRADAIRTQEVGLGDDFWSDSNQANREELWRRSREEDAALHTPGFSGYELEHTLVADERASRGDFADFARMTVDYSAGITEAIQRSLTLQGPKPIIDSYFANYQASHPLAHNKQLMLDTQRASYQRYVDEMAVIEQYNQDAYGEHLRSWREAKGVAYKTSVATMKDARARAEEFGTLAQDFRVQAGQRVQTQVTKYAAGGVLLNRGGSSAERMKMTRERGEMGAERLELQGAEELRRGKILSTTIREEALEPAYIPRSMPASIQDPDDPNSALYKARKKLENEFKALGFTSEGYKSGTQKVERIIGWDYSQAGLSLQQGSNLGTSSQMQAGATKTSTLSYYGARGGTGRGGQGALGDEDEIRMGY